MNSEMAYLLGMICGNGEIKRGVSETIFSIEIPHKKLATEEHHDIKLYVKASIADIKNITEPLVGAGMTFIQNKSATVLSFSKPNSDYLTREILQYIGMATSHNNVKLHEKIFNFTKDEKRQFLKGFADVTGYIRRSNYFFDRYMHRVYLEIPYNWELVVDISNLLKDLDVPVQSIDWAHPNMRDPKLKKYDEGKHNFWKKEHQIKIWASEFSPIGFGVLHKQQSLEMFAAELIQGLKTNGVTAENKTHLFYWEMKEINKNKLSHPSESDDFIPDQIRGKHFNSWKEIAKELGYGE
ncbi:MAG: hypothetical protein FWF92_06460 [Oscillospiraceae bacterium]|nr:hypothetical protein [Oscillospiraceae bacterium]